MAALERGSVPRFEIPERQVRDALGWPSRDVKVFGEGGKALDLMLDVTHNGGDLMNDRFVSR